MEKERAARIAAELVEKKGDDEGRYRLWRSWLQKRVRQKKIVEVSLTEGKGGSHVIRRDEYSRDEGAVAVVRGARGRRVKGGSEPRSCKRKQEKASILQSLMKQHETAEEGEGGREKSRERVQKKVSVQQQQQRIKEKMQHEEAEYKVKMEPEETTAIRRGIGIFSLNTTESAIHYSIERAIISITTTA